MLGGQRDMKTIDHRVMCFEVSVGRSGHLIKRFRYANQSACYDQSDHEHDDPLRHGGGR